MQHWTFGLIEASTTLPAQLSCVSHMQALRDWDLDGFKLDFIDSFRMGPDTPRSVRGWTASCSRTACTV